MKTLVYSMKKVYSCLPCMSSSSCDRRSDTIPCLFWKRRFIVRRKNGYYPWFLMKVFCSYQPENLPLPKKNYFSRLRRSSLDFPCALDFSRPLRLFYQCLAAASLRSEKRTYLCVATLWSKNRYCLCAIWSRYFWWRRCYGWCSRRPAGVVKSFRVWGFSHPLRCFCWCRALLPPTEWKRYVSMCRSTMVEEQILPLCENWRR